MQLIHWGRSPLVEKPRGNPPDYTKLHEFGCSLQVPEVDAYEIDSGYSVDKAWLDDLALHTQVTIKKSDPNWTHGRILYSALRKYIGNHPALQNIIIVETGTARGFSAVTMARALADSDSDGTIVTFDVLPHATPIYWNTISDHSGKRTRRELLEPWADLVEKHIIFVQGESREQLQRVAFERVNFIFFDAAHTYEEVWFEFNAVRERQLPGDVVVYDDYSPTQFPGVTRAVDEICEKFGYEKMILSSPSGRGYVIATKL